jgi:hypothetical protein
MSDLTDEDLLAELYERHPSTARLTSPDGKRDLVSQWRAVKSLVGGEVDNYPIEFAAIFNQKKEDKVDPTPEFSNKFSKFAKRASQQLIEMVLVLYPNAGESDKEKLRNILVTAQQLAGRGSWDPKAAGETLGGIRGVTKNVGHLLHQMDNHQPELYDNNLEYGNYLNTSYTFNKLASLKVHENQQAALNLFAKQELGANILEKLLYAKERAYAKIAAATQEDIKKSLRESLESSRLTETIDAYGYNMSDTSAGDAMAVKNYWYIITKYPLEDPPNKSKPKPPSTPALFLFNVGLKPIVFALIVVLAVVVIGVVIYFIVRAVRKEKMNIIPRSTLRRLNPYNQTFFV